MNWTAPIDGYCERIGPGFWAEPVNAGSNASFLLACLVLLWRLRRDGWRDAPAALLAAWIGVIGIGSFLFHTFANRWALMADVLPIQAFILGYFLLAMRRFLGLGRLPALGVTTAFFVLAAAIPRLVRLAGSGGYLGGLLAMAGVGAALLWRAGQPNGAGLAGGEARRTAGRLFTTAALFSLSLVFRSIDDPVCAVIPVGTHALWHLLNGLVLFLLVDGARRAGPGDPDSLRGAAFT